MRVLIADDDHICRMVLSSKLTSWGFEIHEVTTGGAALAAMQQPDAPKLALLDWMMPEMDGPDICRVLREKPSMEPPYLILLTGRTTSDDIVEGLTSGANDYVTKPFQAAELEARLRIAARVVELQGSLAQRVIQLEVAIAQVRELSGMLPICCYCKKIRDDGNYWHQVEAYLSRHAQTQFSHSICPECFENVVKPELDNFCLDPEHHEALALNA